MATDLTIDMLREIRDGLRDLPQDMNTQISGLRGEVSGLDTRVRRVEHGLEGTFMRTIALDQERRGRFHIHQVERIESDVDNLEARVERRAQQAERSA